MFLRHCGGSCGGGGGEFTPDELFARTDFAAFVRLN